MKKLAVIVLLVLSIVGIANIASAEWGHLDGGGVGFSIHR